MSKTIELNNNSPPILYLCNKDKRLAKLINMVGPIAYTLHDEDPYAFLIYEIIEQMLSIKSARSIYSRLLLLCNNTVSPETIDALSHAQIRGIGLSERKTSTIKELTRSILSGALDLDELKTLSDKDILEKLTSFNGVGMWTAKMYLIFILDRPDILPYEDAAFLQVFGWMYKTTDRSKDSVIKKCRKWKPYSSTASRYLYHALDTGLTKEEFHLFKQTK